MGYCVRFDIRLLVNPKSKICEAVLPVGRHVLPKSICDVDPFAVSIKGVEINWI